MNKDGGDKNLWRPDSAVDPFAPIESPQRNLSQDSSQVPEPEVSDENPEMQQSPELENQPEQVDDKSKMPAIEPIRWTASDTLEIERSKSWNLGLIGIAALIIGGIVVWSILRDAWSASNISIIVLVVISLIAIMIVSKKPHRQVEYMLTESGITIDGQLHDFSQFRAFGVLQNGSVWQLVLIPTKRFGANITAFINSDQGERIVDEFGARLPMEKVSTHPVDKLSRLLKL